MDLKRIQQIVNNQNVNWREQLLEEIAKDKNAIQSVLYMLDAERNHNDQLVTDLNFQLSRAHVTIRHPEVDKECFVDGEIKKFYQEGRVKHCYANMD